MNDVIELKLTTREDAECLYKVRQFKERGCGGGQKSYCQEFLRG